MHKIKNYNISSINRFFLNRMKILKNNIQLLDTTIAEYKSDLTEWYNKLYKTDKHTNESNNIKHIINLRSSDFKYYKSLRIQYTNEYKELKQMQKTLNRAIEERWMNGFADGVKFVNEVLDENLKVLV